MLKAISVISAQKKAYLISKLLFKTLV